MKVTNRKRKRVREVSGQKINNEKNVHLFSSKIKKNFVAKISDKNRKIKKFSTELEEIMKGDEIIFEQRKKKAKSIIEQLNKININDNKNHEIIKNKANQALLYDNISKEIIYQSLKYFKKINNEEEFEKALSKAKYSLTNKMELFYNNESKNIDITKEFNLSDDFLIFEDDETIIEEIKNSINNLELIHENLKDIKIDNLTRTQILKSKIIQDDKGLSTVEKKEDNNNEKLQNIYNSIYDFLLYFIFIDNFQYYGINQSIDYKTNSTIYLINIFYKIFDNTTKLSEWGGANYVNIDEVKIKKLYSLKKLKNHIFDLIKTNNNQINKNIDDKIDLFFFYLESDYFPNDLEKVINSSIVKNEPLNVEEIKKFIENNKNNNKKFQLNNNIMSLNYKDTNYKFNLDCYNNKLLTLLNSDYQEFIEQAQWNQISMIKFFDENDISFIKKLLTKILKSPLFTQVYNEYSNVHEYTDYYFSENKNIDDLLERIKFLPFEEKHTGRQGGTFPNELKIITSSYYISKIVDHQDYINYKLLEVGRKLIILLHEIIHFIKRALNLITNGNISATTIESDKEDPDIIEAGRFLEQVLFNWENPFIEKNKKRPNSSKIKNIEDDEEEENKKKINIRKVLKLLDPNTYYRNIDDFKTYFESEEDIDIKNIDEILKDFLKNINFDINDYNKNKTSYQRYKINCSRKEIFSYYIEYKSD